ncbi:hypothetical protein LOC71_23000 [Rhodopirellula sp. JC740]|uniref:Secreted protein n=1 Tax=Rhodopirellula halodulae TaxID=2894198 RepID=A0ABS8NQC0_9BACT|nr:hypothetical protein [Rhodopirellula sp. JC740]MCC9645157.1 hypothetical protein [Rhodopirellula sp. JC740]
MTQRFDWKQLACVFTLLTCLLTPMIGCGPGGNTVVEPEGGPMTPEEMQAYEEQAQQQTENYEDNYR